MNNTEQQQPVTAETIAAAFRQQRAEERAEKEARRANKTGEAPKTDRFDKEIKKLLEREDVQKENVELIAGLIKAARKDVEDQLEHSNRQSATQGRDQRFIAALDSAIGKYTDGDEALSDMHDLLRQKCITEYLNDPEHAGSRTTKFMRGEIDERALAGLAKKHVERQYKLWGRDASAKGPALGKGVPSAQVSSDAGATTLDGFDERQREVYKAHKSQLMQHIGATIGGEQITAEIAEKKALAAASRIKR